MVTCAAVECRSRTKKQNDCYPAKASFHGFPLRHPQLLRQWLHNLGRKNFSPNINSRLCSFHFLPDCFVVRSSSASVKRHKVTLKRNAVPTEFSHRSALETESSSERTRRQERRIQSQMPSHRLRIQFREARNTACGQKENVNISRAESRNRRYRRNLEKNHPEMFKQLKTRDALKKRLYRAELTEDKRKHHNETARLRMIRYRQRQKGKNKDTPSPIGKKRTRADTETQEQKRKKWTEAKRKQRQNMTAQKKKRMNEKRRARYKDKVNQTYEYTKQLTPPNNDQQTPGGANSTVKPKTPERPSSAKRVAVHRAGKSLPRTPRRCAQTVKSLIDNATPRKVEALVKVGIHTKKNNLNAQVTHVVKKLFQEKIKKYGLRSTTLQGISNGQREVSENPLKREAGSSKDADLLSNPVTSEQQLITAEGSGASSPKYARLQSYSSSGSRVVTSTQSLPGGIAPRSKESYVNQADAFQHLNPASMELLKAEGEHPGHVTDGIGTGPSAAVGKIPLPTDSVSSQQTQITEQSSTMYQKDLNLFSKSAPMSAQVVEAGDLTEQGLDTARPGDRQRSSIFPTVFASQPLPSQSEGPYTVQANSSTGSADNVVHQPEVVDLEEQPEAAAAQDTPTREMELEPDTAEQIDEPYERPVLTTDDILSAFGNDHSYSCAARWARLLVKAAKSIQSQKMLGVLLEIVDRLEGLLDNGTDDAFCSMENLLSTVHQQRMQLHYLMGVVTQLEKENSTMKAEISRFSEFKERTEREGVCGDVEGNESFQDSVSPGRTKKRLRPDRKRLLKELSKVDLNIELIKQDPKLCRRYTGFPNYYLFNAVFSTLETEVTKRPPVSSDRENLKGTEHTTKPNASATLNDNAEEEMPSQLNSSSETSLKQTTAHDLKKPTSTGEGSKSVDIEMPLDGANKTASGVTTDSNSVNSKTSTLDHSDTDFLGHCEPSEMDPIPTISVTETQSLVDSVPSSSKQHCQKTVFTNKETEHISRSSTPRHQLSLEEEFLAALVRIKTDLPLTHLAQKFNIPGSGMDKVTMKWAHLLLSTLPDLQNVPDFNFTVHLRTLVKRFLSKRLRGHINDQSYTGPRSELLDDTGSVLSQELEQYTISTNW